MGESESTAYAVPLRLGVVRGVWLALAIAIITYVGWRAFWFLTDDSFIEFRYASNALLGRGLVWNPAPFAPVEGYTSLLWTLLLFVVWRVTGSEPPAFANWLSLAFGLGTLFLVMRIGLSMRWPRQHARLRLPLLLIAMLGTLGNRTFLAWLSSGLETSLFNFTLLGWLSSVLALRTRTTPSHWPLLMAVLVALTRPDGLLFCAVSVPLVLWHARVWEAPLKRAARVLWPLLIVLAHLLFRLLSYGELLPNTYYAKHAAPWPESGLRYVAAFALEYGLWIWLALVSAAALRVILPAFQGSERTRYVRENMPALVGVAAVLGQVGYYTLLVGGDHFEFRIYSYLIPLLFLSAASASVWLASRPLLAYLPLAFFVLMSWPIPWMHWWKTHDLTTRNQTYTMRVKVADDLPGVLYPLAHAWDELEWWLIKRHVGMRHQEHKMLGLLLREHFPTREVGARISWQQHVVDAEKMVGVVGYVYPNVAIIDLFGLNDRVIAHNPLDAQRARLMAHERFAPPGYVECFKPNLTTVDRQAQVAQRTLTDAEIRSCERMGEAAVSARANAL